MEVLKNNKGFTLVESLVALVILAIALLGLLTGLMVAIDINTRNILRDEAVKIADEYGEICRNDITKCTPSTEERQFRNFKRQYNVDIRIDNPTVTSGSNINAKIVTITVTWQYRGKNYSHTIKTAVGGT